MTSFSEFWPRYLENHSHPWNRRLHLFGMVSAVGMTASALVLKSYLLFLCAPLAAFALAWTGHFVVERNTPAFLGHPLWALRGELKLVRAEISRLF